MAFGGRKGEWVVVIGCGTNRLEGAMLVSNVMGIWGEKNSLCQLPRSGRWRDSHPFLSVLAPKASYLILNLRNVISLVRHN